MNKIFLATIVAILINLPSAFSQMVLGQIQYEGETFELVAMNLSDLHLTGEDRVADVLKMGRILGLRPFTEETRKMIEPKILELLAQEKRVFVAREPFTRGNTKLYVECFKLDEWHFVPIGDVNRDAYATIRWFYRDGDVFLFLRAIHSPKP